MSADEHRDAAHQGRGVTRRAALRAAATGAGATAAALWLNRLSLLAQDRALHTHVAAAAAAQAAAPYVPKALTPAQLETVATLAELIIPTTDTPGARAALVDRFIDNVMANAKSADKERFAAGLAWLDSRSTTLYGGKAFTGATPEQRAELLTKLAAPSGHAAEDAPGLPLFTAMKALTISGYYSTRIGLEKELGDSGQLMSAVFEGCTHPEHQA
jgi:gluconate 2-dehydrogenase gamma chain